MVSVAVIGASGRVGGEMLGILNGHPQVSKIQAISRLLAGQSIAAAHPQLGNYSDKKFVSPDDVAPCDVVLFSQPHGSSSAEHSLWNNFAPLVIDLNSDFRLREPLNRETKFDRTQKPQKNNDPFVLGIPEYFRKELQSAKRIATPSCIALASILAIKPLTDRGLIGPVIFIDAKAGSTGTGQYANATNHDNEGIDTTKAFMPNAHRHEIEVSTVCSARAYVTVNEIEGIQGVSIAAYSELSSYLTDAELRTIYREAYGNEPFTRIMEKKGAPDALPATKYLSGTNHCNIGFTTTHDEKCVTVFAAMEDFTKGAAGNAIHCMNIALGYDELSGLVEMPLQLA